MSAFRPGQTVDGFELREFLRTSSGSQLWKALQIRLGREVILKILDD